jgi:hypothetical protein
MSQHADSTTSSRDEAHGNHRVLYLRLKIFSLDDAITNDGLEDLP